MHVPKQFAEDRVDVLHALMRAYPFATFVAPGASELLVNHLPFVAATEPGPHGVLRGHVARANPVWRELANRQECVAVFQGPHSYISPSWYPSKKDHGKVVPTWNYAVVHAHGVPRAIENRDWLLQLVSELTDRHEQSQPEPWQVADAPQDFIDKLLGAIVGIELPISRLTGKWKVSQNRPMPDRQGVVMGLDEGEDTDSRAMAELVRQAATARQS